MIINVTHVPDSSLVTIFWKEPQNHSCPILEYLIYYRVIKEGDNEPWIRKNVSRMEMQNIQQYEMHLRLGRQYEVKVTARNFGGESSMDQAIPAILYSGEM